MKHEISQQVRELRAQKHNQRGRSPGSVPEHRKPAGQGPSKVPVKRHKVCSGQEPDSQSNPSPYLPGPNSQKEKSRDRPLSAPSQAAIKGLMSQDSQLKAHPHVICPGQVQNPTSSKPVALLVSSYRRGRSHSPCNRIDVDIEPENLGEWHKPLRQSVSHDGLTMPLDSEEFDQTDFLSQSFPVNALSSALRNKRTSYSPAPSSSNLLQVPDNNHLLFHTSDMEWNLGPHAIRGSSSMCDLSASAPAGLLKRGMGNKSESLNFAAAWLCLSPRNCSQLSYPHSPASSVSPSTSPGSPSRHFLSPPFSPDSPGFNKESPTYPTLVFPNQNLFPTGSPHCSPQGSPFGSQTQIAVRSVGAAEC